MPSAPAPVHAALHGKVMVGYQGWFRTPHDKSGGKNWFHYQPRTAADGTPLFQPGTATQPEYLNIDYWPEVTGLPADAVEPTPFRLTDGTQAPVFTSYSAGVVLRHFTLMGQGGIHGAFVQRFANGLAADPAQNDNSVLGWELAAAAQTGRSVAIMYDLSGATPAQVANVSADWAALWASGGPLGPENAPNRAAYQCHGGRPVVAVWGVGFNDGRTYTTGDVVALLGGLKTPVAPAPDVCLVLGVPRGWRTAGEWPPCDFGTQDATNDRNLPAALAYADIISPWTVGRFGDLGEARFWGQRTLVHDLAWCRERGKEYLPVVWPGFSNRNQQAGVAASSPWGTVGTTIDRVAGRLLWEQYYQAITAGCTMIYQAMFDEMDEGTQIMPVAQGAAVPPGQHLLAYEAPLPGDFYLQVVERAARALAGPAPLPPTIPLTFSPPAVNEYLIATDVAVYTAAEESFQTNTAIARLMPILAAWIGRWAPVDHTGRQVRQTGSWKLRPAVSEDPAATIAWKLPVPAAGPYRIQVRLMGDAQQRHVRDALLVVTQGGVEQRLSLDQQHATQCWRPIAASDTPWNLVAGECLLTASFPVDVTAASPQLAFFEARLVAG